MPASLLRIALALLLLGLCGVLEAMLSCRNEDGDAVDWFTFYKLPKKQDEGSRKTGLEYLYLDSTTRRWRKSQQLMNTTTSVLGRTLEQLYEAYASKNNSTAYLIYNDGVPNSVNYSRKYGHTKGILLWNRVQGFWLIHSVPRFPPAPEEGYGYPPTGRHNGQTGICVTFKYNQYEVIGNIRVCTKRDGDVGEGAILIHCDYNSQLLVCNPNIYSCYIPAIFHQELVHMPQLCARSHTSETPGRHLASLQSAQGHHFLHFAKSDSFLDDIFAAWMAQRLKTHSLTETWQRKRQALPSNCSLPYHVYNVKAIKISRQSYFSSYQDHAKWCVSQKSAKNRWTCIGDLNRSPYQAFRSGGFICTQNQRIYQAFQGLVLYYENCN